MHLISNKQQNQCDHHVLSATERNFISPFGFPGWKSLKLGALSNPTRLENFVFHHDFDRIFIDHVTSATDVANAIKAHGMQILVAPICLTRFNLHAINRKLACKE